MSKESKYDEYKTINVDGTHQLAIQAAKAGVPKGEASPASETPAAARAPISSAEVDVVNVSEAAPEKKKRGWWSRS